MTHTLEPRIWPLGNVDHLHARINFTDPDGNPVDIADDVPVFFTFNREDYYAGQWIGDVAPTRVCRIFIDGDDGKIPSGAQALEVFVRPTDDPTEPLVPVGSLEII